jgi:hypothetical protein
MTDKKLSQMREQVSSDKRLRRSNSVMGLRSSERKSGCLSQGFAMKQIREKLEEIWPQLETMDGKVSNELARTVAE